MAENESRQIIENKLPLPIGVSDYRRACSQYYYVDKTLFLKDFLDDQPLVSLFTRPRRFGKTLNMDMIRTFFEISKEDTSIYFKDKKIWNCGPKYREYQRKFPVIFVTFKDVKFVTWAETLEAIQSLLIKEAYRHIELQTSTKCDDYDKKWFSRLLASESSEVELSQYFQNLSSMLHKHYGVAPIILIDEYDIPIQQGYVKGFYEEVILFMRNLFSGGFKDNHHLSYGILTGILRVAKESIFSGLNNLSTYSVLDKKYNSYFGFTEEEVKSMAQYYGNSNKLKEIRDWYNGYQFGNQEIYNPWSVVSYFNNICQPRAYWQSTGSNDVIQEIIPQANQDIYDRLVSLMNGTSFTTYIDTGVIYPEIHTNPSSVYSFLLVAGYLKAENTKVSWSGDYICDVSIPNKEIAFVYNKEILQKLKNMISPSVSIKIQEALLNKDTDRLKDSIRTLLIESVSYFDTAKETFYHGLMLGLCAVMSGHYLTSNRESGQGRFDIQLLPKDKRFPGIIIELKSIVGNHSDTLKKEAEKALQQIIDKSYDVQLKSKGISKVYKYGVAFQGKNVEVVVKD